MAEFKASEILKNPMVQDWINKFTQFKTIYPNCNHCGFPHTNYSPTYCNKAYFGCVKICDDWYYINRANVEIY